MACMAHGATPPTYVHCEYVRIWVHLPSHSACTGQHANQDLVYLVHRKVSSHVLLQAQLEHTCL